MLCFSGFELYPRWVPLTKGPVIKFRNNCRKELEIKTLLSGVGHSLACF